MGESQKTERWGECRLNPPGQALHVDGRFRGAWPRTEAEDWCGKGSSDTSDDEIATKAAQHVTKAAQHVRRIDGLNATTSGSARTIARTNALNFCAELAALAPKEETCENCIYWHELKEPDDGGGGEVVDNGGTETERP